MPLKTKLMILICTLLIGSKSGFGQGEGNDRVETPSQLWNEVYFSTRINNKWIAKTDLFWSLSSDWEQPHNLIMHSINYGIRIGAHYFPRKKIRVTPTLGYWYNIEVKEINQKEEQEWRPACDLQYFNVFGRFTLFNRIRYESRFIKTAGEDHFHHIPRLRYVPKVFIAINGKSIREKTLYAIVSDEVLINLNKDGIPINQNRFTIGAGYCFTNNFTLESTYMRRYTWQAIAPDIQNNVVSISLTMNNLLKTKPKK